MDQSDIFKTKAFYKHTKDREKDHVTEKSNDVFPSGVYVAGKYSPLKYIDTPVRVEDINTSPPSVIIEHTTNFNECKDVLLRVDNFIIKPARFEDYVIYEIIGENEDPLLKVVNIEIIGTPDFMQYHQSNCTSKSDPLLQLSNMEIQSNLEFTTIEDLCIGDNFPETMVRVNTITSSKFTIERS